MKDIGPGKYETINRPEAYTKQISWNLGKVPFSNGAQRFNYETKEAHHPAPNHYNTDSALKSMSPSVNKPTAPFTSKVDKIGIFKAEEKRI
jgi:hypothetical protein